MMSENVATAAANGRAPSLFSPALTRIVLWGVVLAGAAWLLEHIKTTLTVFGLAFVIAYLLNSLVVILESRYQMARAKAIGLVYSTIFAAFLITAAVLVPVVVNQVNFMARQLPTLSQKITDLAARARAEYASRVPEEYQDQVKESIQGSADKAVEIARWVFDYIKEMILGIVSAAFLLLTAFIVSIYVMFRWRGIGEGVLGALPRHYREEIRELGLDLHNIFGGYLKAQILLSTLSGIITGIMLFLHSLVFGHNPYIVILSAVAVVTFPIPVINQFFTCTLGGVLGYMTTGDFTYAGSAFVVIYLVNLGLDRTLAPALLSEAVGVSPLFVLFAAFSGAELLGPVEALLGVPLAAMAKSIFVWFHGRFLRNPEAEVDEEAVGKLLKPGGEFPVRAYVPDAPKATEAAPETKAGHTDPS